MVFYGRLDLYIYMSGGLSATGRDKLVCVLVLQPFEVLCRKTGDHKKLLVYGTFVMAFLRRN